MYGPAVRSKKISTS